MNRGIILLCVDVHSIKKILISWTPPTFVTSRACWFGEINFFVLEHKHLTAKINNLHNRIILEPFQFCYCFHRQRNTNVSDCTEYKFFFNCGCSG